uniref:Fibroin light chain n=1 Tax=Rhyacophila obliterata TaxID=460686 RepID=C5NML2_9NEOP|nr:fibroin light chain [Rhyacophila obliterata]
MALLLLTAAFLATQGIASAAIQPALIEATWRLVEDGEIPPFALLLRDELIAEAGPSSTELYALGATFTAVGELAWPRAASGCGHSKLINACVGFNDGSTSYSELSDAIDSYAVVLSQAVDNLRILGYCCIVPAPWPPMDNSCNDYGRIYSFEDSWDLAKGAGNKARCIARRLYTSFGARLNNIGAAATSAATIAAREILEQIENDLVTYLNTVVKSASGSWQCAQKKKNMLTLGGYLKSAIWKAASVTKHNLS